MRTASIREVRHDFSRILEWVANGEEVAITKRRQTVARLLPAVRGKIVRAQKPDVAARLRKVFGRKIISDQTMKVILEDNRGNY
ncbi:MAG TPA: type II toxin-antitoxin system Phd/YefM family antitoxin [Verrucomicrobiae bacterium]|jgi:antitoxin (DNA-binding transcriptional repressor) of toxin-antitoxin stability system